MPELTVEAPAWATSAPFLPLLPLLVGGPEACDTETSDQGWVCGYTAVFQATALDGGAMAKDLRLLRLVQCACASVVYSAEAQRTA